MFKALLLITVAITFAYAAPQYCSPSSYTNPIVPGVCTEPLGTDTFGIGTFATPGTCAKNDVVTQLQSYAVIVALAEAKATLPPPAQPCTAAGWAALFEHLCFLSTTQCVDIPTAPIVGSIPYTACEQDCVAIQTAAFCNMTKLDALIRPVNPTAANAVQAAFASCASLLPSQTGGCRENSAVTTTVPPPTPPTGQALCGVESQPFVLGNRFGTVCLDYQVQISQNGVTHPVTPITNVAVNASFQETLVGGAANVDLAIDSNGLFVCPTLPNVHFVNKDQARQEYSRLACAISLIPTIPNPADPALSVAVLPCREVCINATQQCGGYELWFQAHLGTSFYGSFSLLTLGQQCNILPKAGGAVPCNLAPYVGQAAPQPQPKTFSMTNLNVAPVAGSVFHVDAYASFIVRSGNSDSAFSDSDNCWENAKTQVAATGTFQIDGGALIPWTANSFGCEKDTRVVTTEYQMSRDWGTTLRFCVTSLAYPGFQDDVTPSCTTYQKLADNVPNVILIIADDMGFGDLSMFDSSARSQPLIPTPRLQQMVDQGQKHMQMLMGDSTCTPSRAAMLSGRYPIRYDMASNERRVVTAGGSPGGMNVAEYLIGDMFKEHGYATAFLGKWHLGINDRYDNDYAHLPTNFGYDTYYGIPLSNSDLCASTYPDPLVRGHECFLLQGDAYSGDMTVIEQPMDVNTVAQRLTERAIQFITKFGKKPEWWEFWLPRTPFHLVLSFATPHTALGNTPSFTGTGGERGPYGDAVAELDYSVGQVLDTLTDLGIEKETYVIFVSDNGPALEQRQNGGKQGVLKGGKGQSSWNGGYQVPGISYWPGTIPAGSVSQTAFSGLDLFPTFASLLGVQIPQGNIMDGIDYSSVLKNPAAVLAERPLFHYCGKIMQAARLGPYKVHFATNLWSSEATYGIEACAPPPGGLGTVVCECTYVTVQPQPNLAVDPPDFTNWPPVYDIITDPGETTPLAKTPQLEAWYVQLAQAVAAHELSLGVVPPGNLLLANRMDALQPLCTTWESTNPNSCLEPADNDDAYDQLLEIGESASGGIDLFDNILLSDNTEGEDFGNNNNNNNKNNYSTLTLASAAVGMSVLIVGVIFGAVKLYNNRRYSRIQE